MKRVGSSKERKISVRFAEEDLDDFFKNNLTQKVVSHNASNEVSNDSSSRMVTFGIRNSDEPKLPHGSGPSKGQHASVDINEERKMRVSMNDSGSSNSDHP